MVAGRAQSQEDVYGEVNSIADLRKINRMIRQDMQGVKSREQLTELKKRSDYLCTLIRSPSWRTKFGDKAFRMLDAAKGENQRTTRMANRLARRMGIEPNYDPWGND